MAEGAQPYRDIPLAASELPGLHAKPGCRKCGCASGYLARYIKVNGAVSLRWVCEWCEDYGTTGDLPSGLLRGSGVTPGDLPIRRDRRGEDSETTVQHECVVCGADAAEFHHWAPVSIFRDWYEPRPEPGGSTTATRWLDHNLSGVWLCAEHHHEWHARMRAHGLRWPHELKAETW